MKNTTTENTEHKKLYNLFQKLKYFCKTVLYGVLFNGFEAYNN